MIHVNVRQRDAAAQATEPITSGSVGLAVSFRFSEDWTGLAKAALFKGSGTAVDVALTGSECAVPHEVLQLAGGHLKIGVYGTGNQGQRVTPTVWADAGQIFEGAAPSEVTPTPATQNLVQQALEAAESAEAIAQSLRDDAEAGEFDGEDGASAYELAVEQGYNGTEAQWLQSLRGQDATVDATLSNAGEAADAAVTGAGISAARHTGDYALLFAETLNNGAGIPVDGVWERGGIGTNGNAENTRTYRARTKNKLSYPVAITLKAASGYRFQLASYRQDGTFVDITDGTTSRDVPANTIFRLVSKKVPEDTGELVDPAEFGSKITIQNNMGSGGGGSITVDSALSDSSENPVQNKVIKAALDNKGTYSKPSGGIPASDLASGVIPTVPSASSAAPQALGTAVAGSSTDYARADHVHAKPSAADVGAVASNQGSGNAGKFLVVGSDGNVTTMTLAAWQGGNY